MTRSTQLSRFYIGTFWLYAADQIILLAARWGMVTLARSSLLLALVVILHALPQVAVGVLGPERVAGRRLPRIALAGGVALGALWLLGSLGLTPLTAVLLAAALIAGWANAALVPLGQASLMQFLPVAARVRGSRDYEISSRIPLLAAPVVGGGLIALVGLSPLTVAGGVLLLLAAWAYGRWPEAELAPRAGGMSLRQSLAVLRRDRWLLTALSVRGVQNLFWPAFTLALPLLVAGRLHRGALAYGLLLTCYGVATLLAAGLSGRVQLAHLRWLYFLSWVTTGVGFMVLAEAPNMPLAVLGAALGGIGSPFVHMALDSHIGTNVDARAQAALFGFQRLVMSMLSLVGSYAVGWWLTWTRPGPALTASGAALALVGLGGALVALLQGRSALREATRQASS
jgi:hypothetical protein